VQYQGFFSTSALHCIKSPNCGWFAALVQVGTELAWRVYLKENFLGVMFPKADPLLVITKSSGPVENMATSRVKDGMEKLCILH